MAATVQEEEEIQSCERKRTAASANTTTTTTTTTTANPTTCATTNTSYTPDKVIFSNITIRNFARVVDEITVHSARHCEYHLINIPCIIRATQQDPHRQKE